MSITRSLCLFRYLFPNFMCLPLDPASQHHTLILYVASNLFFSHHKLKRTNIFVEMKKRLCLHFTAFLCSRNSLGLLLAWKKNLAQQKMVREGSPEDLFFPQNFLLNSLLKAATTQIHLHFFVYCHLDKPFF